MIFSDGLLYILTSNKVLYYDGTSLVDFSTFTNTPFKLAQSAETGISIATNKGIFNNNFYYYPNGPTANQFPNMIVDKESNFWSASGKDVTGVGLYMYNGIDWTSYLSLIHI